MGAERSDSILALSGRDVYIATDATGVLVQANDRCKNRQFWVLVAEGDHVIYRYSKRHSSEEPKKLLAGFRGTVVADASNVYDALYRQPDGPTEGVVGRTDAGTSCNSRGLASEADA